MTNSMELSEKRAVLAEEALDKTLKAVRDKAKQYNDIANQQRKKYGIAKFFAIVLGVLAPTVVAFQSQTIFGEYAYIWGLFAILITAGTGIVTGLQASFKWGEDYARSAIASLELNELAGSIELESLIYRTTPDLGLKYDKLKELHEKTWKKMQSIVQSYTQAQVSSVLENELSDADRQPE